MKCLQLLFVCWCFSIPAVTSAIKVDGYLCVSSYWWNISCVLNITGNPMKSSNYSLKFSSREPETSCPLVVMNHSYSCDCKVNPHYFSSYQKYAIKLCHDSECHVVTEKFLPSQNIQLTPPFEVEVQQTPETVNITWKSGYEDHAYLKSVLDYEVLLQTTQSKKSQTLHPNLHEEFISVQRSLLESNAGYCIKVRSLPGKTDYKGNWSKWSPSKCWNIEAGQEQDNKLAILIKSLGPVCVAVGVLLFVFYSPAARMKIKTLSHTPSPAPFFQPLFQQHEGNLKEWLSPHGKCVLTYKTEEIMTTDSVVVVPKPITKDPEENRNLHTPSVPQLAFIQCQTSYVGLPGIHEASPPLTMICQGDTSYTQLPCSVWVESSVEVEVASSPPKDFLNISHADSGCSCEDLTQRPECSVPNSPVDDSPPPCNCNDYCILKKTAEGFSPVLVSKEGSLNVPSDSLQEYKSQK